MSFWSKDLKKNKLQSKTTIKLENNIIVIQTYLTKDEAIAIREKLRNDYRNIPTLNKDTFEQCWKDFIRDDAFDEFFQESVQQLSDESDEPSNIEPW